MGRCVATLRDAFLCALNGRTFFYKNFIRLDKRKLLSFLIWYNMCKERGNAENNSQENNNIVCFEIVI